MKQDSFTVSFLWMPLCRFLSSTVHYWLLDTEYLNPPVRFLLKLTSAKICENAKMNLCVCLAQEIVARCYCLWKSHRTNEEGILLSSTRMEMHITWVNARLLLHQHYRRGRRCEKKRNYFIVPRLRCDSHECELNLIYEKHVEKFILVRLLNLKRFCGIFNRALKSSFVECLSEEVVCKVEKRSRQSLV